MKDDALEDIVRGIRAAARGESPLASRAAQAVVTARVTRNPADTLTKREREVLVLAAQGMANKQIAKEMGITETTVKAHLTNVFQRIGVADRTQAVIWAERHGILPQDSR